jgi:dienelactone hydrolase
VLLRLAVALAVVLGGVAPALGQPAGAEVTVPLTVKGLFGPATIGLAAVHYRPPGDGPFPAVVLSHGSTVNARERGGYVARFPVASDVLVRWGLVVLSPVRRGYGRTGGTFAEDYGPCQAPHFVEAGQETARDIAAAVAWLARQPYVDRERIALVGQSGGGWGSLAAVARGDMPVRAVVNFAGGRGGKQHGMANNNCSPERLVEAAGVLGRTATAPSLWLYTENDHYFAPALSRRMHQAYVAGGGRAAYHLLPAIGRDGHLLIGLPSGVPLWKDLVEAFLRETGVLR